jgi:hypothetical protein
LSSPASTIAVADVTDTIGRGRKRDLQVALLELEPPDIVRFTSEAGTFIPPWSGWSINGEALRRLFPGQDAVDVVVPTSTQNPEQFGTQKGIQEK